MNYDSTRGSRSLAHDPQPLDLENIRATLFELQNSVQTMETQIFGTHQIYMYISLF